MQGLLPIGFDTELFCRPENNNLSSEILETLGQYLGEKQPQKVVMEREQDWHEPTFDN
jgi:hypothetical protein